MRKNKALSSEHVDQYVSAGLACEGNIAGNQRNGTVHVYFSELSQPILLDQAIVRWTDRLEFGVELTSISPESSAKLSNYLTALYPAPEPSPAYGLSPFSCNWQKTDDRAGTQPAPTPRTSMKGTFDSGC